jgi:hypothetical protein
VTWWIDLVVFDLRERAARDTDDQGYGLTSHNGNHPDGNRA